MKTAVTARIRDGLGRSPLLCAFVGVTLLITGCGGGGGSTSGGSSANPAPTVNLGANPNPVNSGDAATLTWSAPNATTCMASGDWIGPRPTSGTEPTSAITIPKNYFLTCTGAGGSANGSVAVTVNQPPVASNGCKNTAWNTPVSIDLKPLVSDPDAAVVPANFAIVAGQGQTKGSVLLDTNGIATYTPSGTAVTGADSFTYVYTDAASAQATGQVKIAMGNRIMPLGDSISAGVFTSTNPAASERVGYRRKLYNDLNAGGKNVIDFVGRYNEGSGAGIADDDHEGRLGLSDTLLASEIAARLSGAIGPSGTQPATLGNGNPDIILLHIGTNGLDAVPYDPNNDVENILNNIDTWEASASNRPVTVLLALIIGSPNDPSGNYACATGVNCDANAVARNALVKSMAEGRSEYGSRLFLVNMYAALGNRTVDNDSGGSGDFADNLHPDTSGYNKMADAWRSALEFNGLVCQ